MDYEHYVIIYFKIWAIKVYDFVCYPVFCFPQEENKIDYSRPWTLIVTGQDGAYFIRPRLFKFDDKDNVKIVSFSQLTFRTVAFHLINFLGELDINNLKYIIIQCDMVEVKELVKIRHKIIPNIKTSNI